MFDVDRTLLPGSSLVRFGRAMVRAGLLSPHRLARHLPRSAVFAARGLGDAELERLVVELLAAACGREQGPLLAVARRTAGEVAEAVYPAARWLLQRHREAGDRVVLLSAGPQEVVAGAGRRPGRPRGRRHGDRGGGRALHRTAGRAVLPRPGEAGSAARRAGRRRPVTASAYGDAGADTPLLASVARPVAVNPDRALRREAASRGWPVLRLA